MKKNMAKMWKALFEILHMSYSTNFCILVIFDIFFTLISLKIQIESENDQNPYIWGYVDHSNPYVYTQYYSNV